MTTVSESVVHITESAAQHIREMLSKETENTGKNLRVYVEAGGCSGMQYGMVFDEKRDGDFVAEDHGVTILVDPVSARQIQGATVDYQDSLDGAGFKISNPNARHSCGCGRSFEA